MSDIALGRSPVRRSIAFDRGVVESAPMTFRAYHTIISAFHFWFPNDPRGSCSLPRFSRNGFTASSGEAACGANHP
jgi:hypothetical protein